MENYARKLANETLLSKKDRDYLTGKINVNRKYKHRFLKDLSIRYLNLIKDLEIIKKDDQKREILGNWKLKNRISLRDYAHGDLFWASFSKWEIIPERTYVSKIHREKKGRKGISFYWIEEKKLNELRDDEINKILEPDYLFTLIKRVKINDEDKKILIQGYEEGVIPISKDKMISIIEIKKRILEKYSPVTKEDKRKLMTEVEQDPRNKKILEIYNSKEFGTLYKKMNKLLEPYESKIVQVQPYLHPISSKKETYYNE